jgi:hypothetical protein
MSKRINPPRTDDFRERTRWERDVSRLTNGGEALPDVEMMSVLMSENNRPNVSTQDLQDVRIEGNMITSDAQSARNALRMAEDSAILAIMGGW